MSGAEDGFGQNYAILGGTSINKLFLASSSDSPSEGGNQHSSGFGMRCSLNRSRFSLHQQSSPVGAPKDGSLSMEFDDVAAAIESSELPSRRGANILGAQCGGFSPKSACPDSNQKLTGDLPALQVDLMTTEEVGAWIRPVAAVGCSSKDEKELPTADNNEEHNRNEIQARLSRGVSGTLKTALHRIANEAPISKQLADEQPAAPVAASSCIVDSACGSSGSTSPALVESSSTVLRSDIWEDHASRPVPPYCEVAPLLRLTRNCPVPEFERTIQLLLKKYSSTSLKKHNSLEASEIGPFLSVTKR